MNRKSYFYELPEEQIAQFPKQERETSRLLVLNRRLKTVEHKVFTDIIDYFKKGDVLVLNTTKVIPARLKGKKTTGAKVEVFLLSQKEDDVWECLVKPGKRLKKDAEVIFSPTFRGVILDYSSEGSRLIKFYFKTDFWNEINLIGEIPLPPYIHRKANQTDNETYQTVYAQAKGSVAAPTAGLHFTENVLTQIKEKGVIVCNVVLHVGLGTFRPVKTDNILEHKMHSEFCEISEETATIINQAKDENRRVIAVGTTTTRTLESFAENGRVLAGNHWTDIFIYPGKKLQIIDGLLTNFHMPESTLLMLVSAFAGYDFIMNSYKIAVKKKYRFFSYGDAMLII
jgi:S-adenosylmethionine:tRNA ribosyltransferase-isomerase